MNKTISKILEGQAFSPSCSVHLGAVFGDYSVSLFLVTMLIGPMRIAYHLESEGHTNKFDQFADVCKRRATGVDWDRTIYLTELAAWSRAKEILSIAYPEANLMAFDSRLDRYKTREQLLRSLHRVSSQRYDRTQHAASAPVRDPAAVCLIASGNPSADETAYWKAQRLSTQRCEFWVVGHSPALQVLDTVLSNVTRWLPTVSDMPCNTHVLEVHASQYVVFN